MRINIAKVLFLFLAITILAGCSTHTGKSATEKTAASKPLPPTREEILRANIRQSAIEMRTLIAEYDNLIKQIQGLENDRTPQRILRELATFLKEEAFSYAKDHANDYAMRSVSSKFSPQSLATLRSTQLYSSVINLAITIANITARLEHLAELNMQAADLKRYHTALVREAFPRMSVIAAILLENEDNVVLAEAIMQQQRSILIQIEATVLSWEARVADLERGLDQ